jgi:hypothetical protein
MGNLITFISAGGVPHDKIMQSLDLFGTKVISAARPLAGAGGGGSEAKDGVSFSYPYSVNQASL